MTQHKDMQRAHECAPFTEYCSIHHVYHHKCAECGVDCTMGTHDGPPTKELDGITRCYDCNQRLSRFQATGIEADVARAAVLAYRKGLSE